MTCKQEEIMAGKGTLYCGAARRVITPPDDLMEEVRGLMAKKFVAVADDICVRVIALKNDGEIWLICGFDLDKAPNPAESMAAISGKYGIPEENITFCAIHTHAAPILGKRENETNNNVRKLSAAISEATDRYEAYVHEKLMEAVDEALADMVPARARFGKAPCGCNINRCLMSYSVDDDGNISRSLHEGANVFGPVDHNVYVLAFEDTDGRPVAYLVNYAMHNTIMFMNNADAFGNGAISSDVGGNVSKMIEKNFPGSVALWCSGAAGDVQPLRPQVHVRREPGEEDYQFDMKEKQAVLKQMCDDQYASVMAALRDASEPFEDTSVHFGLCWTSTPGRTVIREGSGRDTNITVISGPEQPPYRIRVHLVQFGRLIVVGIGGELYSAYALALKEKFPDYDVIVINHDASMIADAGYIMDDATWEKVDSFSPNERTIPGAPPAFEKGYVLSALTESVGQMLDDFKNSGR